ncbi:hypothetical protein [Amycolatopsis alkalitolerans]|uniref:Uncharacterized protein n=1 Tax=Amycolatopsis alkalitolerans TaxID=2547244 RepID=A0A5C4M952_9PSEU|nr:hypothetical protein [Amycolatopsis alkalitolerans]TNC28677.1 hypothetical protein FG385_05350 [Amycolatopsis alkalitolerans]
MLTGDAYLVLAIIALLLALFGCSLLVSRRRARDLTVLAKANGWEEFREKPLSATGTWISRGFRGKYRGYACGAYQYTDSARNVSTAPDQPMYTKKTRWIVRIKVTAPLPNCVVKLTGLDELSPDGIVSPEFEEWFRENASRCSSFEAANGHLTVRSGATMNRGKLLRSLDFLVDVAERLPIHKAELP